MKTKVLSNRVNYSQTVLINFITSIQLFQANNKPVYMILVNLKKAFDSIDHQILKNKLANFSIQDDALELLISCLSKRTINLKL